LWTLSHVFTELKAEGAPEPARMRWRRDIRLSVSGLEPHFETPHFWNLGPPTPMWWLQNCDMGCEVLNVNSAVFCVVTSCSLDSRCFGGCRCLTHESKNEVWNNNNHPPDYTVSEQRTPHLTLHRRENFEFCIIFLTCLAFTCGAWFCGIAYSAQRNVSGVVDRAVSARHSTVTESGLCLVSRAVAVQQRKKHRRTEQ
jgi:hypothetical protein